MSMHFHPAALHANLPPLLSLLQKAAPGAKKPRAKRDKNAPKGAQTAFLFFSSANVSEMLVVTGV